jgi:hypothetical protein
MEKESLLPRTVRANQQRIKEETRRLKWLKKMKHFDHPINTPELAIELHYERGFCATAIVNSGAVGQGVLNVAIHDFRRRRPLHQRGALNTLFPLEELELREWINLKILRHEQPKISEVQQAVCFFILFRFSFLHRPKELLKEAMKQITKTENCTTDGLKTSSETVKNTNLFTGIVWMCQD